MPKPAVIKTTPRPTVGQKAAPIETTSVRVRATRLGFTDHKRRRVGDVFTLDIPVVNGEAKLPSWVELAPGAAPKETGAQAALTKATEEIRGVSNPGAEAASSGDDLGI